MTLSHTNAKAETYGEDLSQWPLRFGAGGCHCEVEQGPRHLSEAVQESWSQGGATAPALAISPFTSKQGA